MNYYAENAQEYAARTRDYTQYPGLRAEVEEFASRLATGGLVVDLGSGSGRDSLLFLGVGLRVLMVDNSVPLLDQARRYVPGPSAVAIAGDVRALPFSDGISDGVWASGSLLHLRRDEMPNALREVWRILKPNGLVALSMKMGIGFDVRSDGREFTYVSGRDVVRLLEDAGFEIERLAGPVRREWLTATAVKRQLS